MLRIGLQVFIDRTINSFDKILTSSRLNPEVNNMNNQLTLNEIAYCGINCRRCNLTTALPQAALKLREIMETDGWEHWGSQVFPEFEQFWGVLKNLTGLQEHCPMCKGDCGNPECHFRLCAREKGLDLCVRCGDYPCEKLREFFSGRYNHVLESNERLREIGIEKWLEEQEKLLETKITNAGLKYD